MSFLNKLIVLKLNANWKPIGVITPEEAFVAMSRLKQKTYTREMKRPYCALNIEYVNLENGEIDYESPTLVSPTEWSDWINLPVRNFDNAVKTARGEIRIPTVVIANNYKHLPQKRARYSKFAIWQRDNFTCQITGEKVTHRTGNIDHWVPRVKGGKSEFENCTILRKDLNSMKGDMTMEEFCKKWGFKLPSKPKKPTGEFVIHNPHGIKDWDLFIEE